ncbi:carboxymuconolactone decarboxylase family protein [Mucilaginibacter robiniae]|uniref:Carboxymuconolactone decarboxylase family protein n=1 Tax=Mucilaginibacter robiniae TaxID=2728022 RepID=A0A7L5EBW6_9SPHI|nr:carboxymuconolactone decarboxylase family protein [Mucilaginibacter robiniae]QJD97906.1 carboxymuconolactone decarboxylase family protein [Mucilaginibacter robiniae]
MRLQPLPLDQLSGTQRTLHENIQTGVQKYLKGFISQRADGALIGPFIPILHFPQFGGPAWDYTMALAENTTLPKPVHEVAILVTGAHFHSRYEIYAHEHVAEKIGLSVSKIATITAGERPSDLSDEEGIAYDVASVLSKGGQLSEYTYQAALKAFGEQGMAELVYLIGGYCLVSVMLNAYDISVPGREEGIG